MVYMATVKQEIVQGMAKIWETMVQQLIIKQGLYVLVKETVVPKKFKSSKEDRT
jgi:hypothetical protein